MTITLTTISDASAKSPSMASFRAGGLACCRSEPIASGKTAQIALAQARLPTSVCEYQVDMTEKQLKDAPKLGRDDNWERLERARDQEVYDYSRVTYYRGAE
jgi:hypothetical protein